MELPLTTKLRNKTLDVTLDDSHMLYVVIPQ